MANPSLIALGLLGPVYALSAHCEVYMSDRDAARAIFPATTFSRHEIELTDAEAEAIERASGETVRSRKLVVWRGSERETVFIDRVLGKHQFITYAVGIDAKGEVKGVEILDYRESYGHQIRRENWRSQFKGKTLASKLKIDDDIKNISGATLSSVHVTAGVKRILHTHDVIKKRI